MAGLCGRNWIGGSFRSTIHSTKGIRSFLERYQFPNFGVHYSFGILLHHDYYKFHYDIELSTVICCSTVAILK